MAITKGKPYRFGFNAVDSTDGSAITTGITVELRIDGTALKPPTNAAVHIKNGAWEVLLDGSETSAEDLSIIPSGTNLVPCSQFLTTEDPVDYQADVASELSTYGAATSTDVSNSESNILSTGGTGPWSTADVATELSSYGAALESTSQSILTQTDAGAIYAACWQYDTTIDGYSPEQALIYTLVASVGNRTNTVGVGGTGTESYALSSGSFDSAIDAQGNRTVTLN